jgi:hypothetical protein
VFTLTTVVSLMIAIYEDTKLGLTASNAEETFIPETDRKISVTEESTPNWHPI